MSDQAAVKGFDCLDDEEIALAAQPMTDDEKVAAAFNKSVRRTLPFPVGHVQYWFGCIGRVPISLLPSPTIGGASIFFSTDA